MTIALVLLAWLALTAIAALAWSCFHDPADSEAPLPSATSLFGDRLAARKL